MADPLYIVEVEKTNTSLCRYIQSFFKVRFYMLLLLLLLLLLSRRLEPFSR